MYNYINIITTHEYTYNYVYTYMCAYTKCGISSCDIKSSFLHVLELNYFMYINITTCYNHSIINVYIVV